MDMPAITTASGTVQEMRCSRYSRQEIRAREEKQDKKNRTRGMEEDEVSV